MKFIEYIREDELIELKKIFVQGSELEKIKNAQRLYDYLFSRCKPFWKATESFRYVFFRGIEEDGEIIEKKVRINRKPRSTPILIQKMVDKILKKRGLPMRSRSVFTYPDYVEASWYGKAFAFFPKGKYKFVYHPRVYDFLGWVRDLDKKIDPKEIKRWSLIDKYEAQEWLEQYVDGLKKDSLIAAHKTGNEVMFECKEYIGISRELALLLKMNTKTFGSKCYC